jgi:deoxyribodipyrimidine photo-lyase
MPDGVRSLVWFKRDLRLSDHEPLARAAAEGPCLCLYVYEDELLESLEYDVSHHTFLNECLHELRAGLRQLGANLLLVRGRMPEVLDHVKKQFPFTRLWSHEETGNGLTYARDLRVKKWCKMHSVEWLEPTQTGVVRRLRSRDGWAAKWQQRMSRPRFEAPASIVSPAMPNWGDPLDFAGDTSSIGQVSWQRGGIRSAVQTLRSFLAGRGRNYVRAMSSPGAGWSGCSRLSPHLAFGTISMRQVFQLTAKTARLLETDGDREAHSFARALDAFSARLHWHCHFMQKLENEPELEFENLARSYDGLRENDWDESRFVAWSRGETGYPMIDACMRSLLRTRWLNFRMRAMLVSFMAYDLWLHWRKPAVYLARYFLDFEPGIHFSQFQMQSGTTGINTLRMYSPTKQLRDHDPKGDFVRQNLPELSNVPLEHLAEPWRMTPAEQAKFGVTIGKHYPMPIVDHSEAIRSAKARLSQHRGRYEVRQEARVIVREHGSRKRPSRGHQASAVNHLVNDQQLSLGLTGTDTSTSVSKSAKGQGRR